MEGTATDVGCPVGIIQRKQTRGKQGKELRDLDVVPAPA